MFQLSLRELFLIVTLAAVLVGWWLDRSGITAQLVETEAGRVAAEDKVDQLMDRYMRVYEAVENRGMHIVLDSNTPNVAIQGTPTPELAE